MTRRHEPPPLDENALREIVEGTAGETGEAFFDALVQRLARAIGTKCAWVTEWNESERRLRALSFWAGDGYVTDFEYDVAETPCEPVIENRTLVHVPDRVVELYAHDESLEPLGAVSYIGVPLFDTDGRILGHLAVLHDEPMDDNPRVLAMFRIFAERAAAELRRLRRDRDLRDREHKLARLVGGAMDAIVETDADRRVTTLNAAAERLFDCDAEQVRGAAFDAFLTKDSRGKLTYLAERLRGDLEDRSSLWIPDGLVGLRPDGTTFPAEATLSRYDAGGRSYFALILRNIDERIEAEERIRGLLRETETLRAEIDALHGFDEIVGKSDALRAVLADVDRVADSDTTVLITGETGTGKELIARAIHRRSPRRKGPLVTVNCAAIAANLQESEFFGHERGAFTGATQRREGRFRLADGGTIFLDEIGEMPVDLQAKLLRVLQEGTFEPVGGTKTEKVDVRVIAATHRDLEAMVEEGSFRSDLMYRLNVFPVRVPALRERGDDVVLLAESFADRLARRRGGEIARLTSTDRSRLLAYDWPGNVRELHNVVERAVLTSIDGHRLNLDRALPEVGRTREVTPGANVDEDIGRILTEAELREIERANLVRALEAAGGKISGAGGAAELLGVHPNTLASRMKSLGVERGSRSKRP